MNQDDYSYIFKIIVIGDSSTGKTSLMRKYIDNKFEVIHDLTIGVEFRTKIEKIEYKGKEIIVKFHIWDTAGQESFRSIIKSYYRGVAGAIILFDVTDPLTFHNIPSWIKELKFNSDNSKLPIVLVGNKTDLYNRKISKKEAEKLAEEYKIPYLENSCKSYTSTSAIFDNLIRQIVKRIHKSDILPNGIRECNSRVTIDLEKKYQESKRCCIIN
tara:strand:- start:908 stop:1549 length:642 start_codon:yes stop_codon:yes gene_type:complete